MIHTKWKIGADVTRTNLLHLPLSAVSQSQQPCPTVDRERYAPGTRRLRASFVRRVSVILSETRMVKILNNWIPSDVPSRYLLKEWHTRPTGGSLQVSNPAAAMRLICRPERIGLIMRPGTKHSHVTVKFTGCDWIERLRKVRILFRVSTPSGEIDKPVANHRRTIFTRHLAAHQGPGAWAAR